MKNNACNAKSFGTNNRGFGYKTKTRRYAMTRCSIPSWMAPIFMAATLIFAPFARAQAQDTDAGVEPPEDAKYIWNDTEDPEWDKHDPARYGRHVYLSEWGGYFQRAKTGGIDPMIEATVKANKRQSAHDMIDPFAAVGLESFKALTPTEFTELDRSARKYLESHGCDMGTPDSSACKALHDELLRILNRMLDVINSPERRAESEGFRDKVSLNYIKNEERNVAVTNYAMLAIFLNTAIRSLPEIAWQYLVAGSVYKHGEEVKFEDLEKLHGPRITVICEGKEVEGILNGETDKDRLVVNLLNAKRSRFESDLSELDTCRYYLIESGAPSRCEEGMKAFKAEPKQTLEGTEGWLTACPEDFDNLKGRKVLYFPPECKEEGKVVSVPKAGEIVVANKELGVIKVKFSDGTEETFDCSKLSNLMIALLPPDAPPPPPLPPPGIGYLSIGAETRGGGIFRKDLDGAGYVMGGLRIDVTPWAGKRLALHLGTGILFGKVWGIQKNAIDEPDSRFDLMVPIRVGGSVLFNEYVSMSLFGDVRFTRAGFGGGGGELSLNITPHERVTISFGPTIGYSIFGVKPGTNHWYDSCNEGAPCTSMQQDTRGLDVGGALSIRINLGIDAAKRRAAAKAKAEAEAETEEE